ncbi:MAG: hypothetical protein RL077_360 [Verrucomicrobiota bacterium]|jgi:hypothetical protein
MTQQEIANIKAASQSKSIVVAGKSGFRDSNIALITAVKNQFFPAHLGCAARQAQADINAIEEPQFFPGSLAEYKLCVLAATTFTPARLAGLLPDVEIVVYSDAGGNGGIVYTRRPWAVANGETPVVAARALALARAKDINAAAVTAGETLLPE